MDEDQNRGLYGKYKVERIDGKSGPGQKHEECDYFVLDINHDPHARKALQAYIDSLYWSREYPELMKDLNYKLNGL